MKDLVRARYVDGRAVIEMEGRTLQVDRRDDDTRIGSCPLELISAALAS
jgi:hypothetical protein